MCCYLSVVLEIISIFEVLHVLVLLPLLPEKTIVLNLWLTVSLTIFIVLTLLFKLLHMC